MNNPSPNWKKYDGRVTAAYCERILVGMPSLLYSLAVDPPEETKQHFAELDELQKELDEKGTLYGVPA